MQRKHQISLMFRQGLSALVAVFFLANTIMFGFMHIPMAKANGASLASVMDGVVRIPIVICTGSTFKTVLVRADGLPDEPGQNADAPDGFECALCGLGNYAFGMPVTPELPELEAIELSNAVAALHITARKHVFCALAPSPRAPPAVS
ncbi:MULTISPECIES: DUF2946 domain-containing protein [unclassified Thalassospira]|uniref:DUF2946 domain-containing protein n=1 Tax=unclassified Thalassospira TaxID=2648997 RepID=UPI0020904CC3|nr:DUF2946 domain-containing protein [Thalassospira sp. A40-3]